jgi:hypothetical protein
MMMGGGSPARRAFARIVPTAIRTCSASRKSARSPNAVRQIAFAPRSGGQPA